MPSIYKSKEEEQQKHDMMTKMPQNRRRKNEKASKSPNAEIYVPIQARQDS